MFIEFMNLTYGFHPLTQVICFFSFEAIVTKTKLHFLEEG